MANIPSLSTDVKNISPLDPTQCPSINASPVERVDRARADAFVITPLPNAPLTAGHVVVPIDGERGRCSEECVNRSFRALASIACIGLGVFGLTYDGSSSSLCTAAVITAPLWVWYGLYCGVSACCGPMRN